MCIWKVKEPKKPSHQMYCKYLSSYLFPYKGFVLTRATKAVPITERESHRQKTKIVGTAIRGKVLAGLGGGGRIKRKGGLTR